MNLVDFIADNKSAIAEEWIKFAQKNILLTKQMNREDIKDHVIQILDRIIYDMRSSQSDVEQKIKSQGNKVLNMAETQAANDHGEQRLDAGFDFMQLSAEFRALRASVLRLWAKEARADNWETDFYEMIRFNEAVDEIWMISLTRFQEKLNESKNLFLGILGHDLRNPISTIKGAHSLLKLSENLSEKGKKTLAYTEVSVDRMTSLINNLLELTELRLGKGMSFQKVPIDLVELSQNIIHEHELAYPQIEFVLSFDDDIHGNWDRLRLSQMMNNLITNAVKHGSSTGTVQITLRNYERHAEFAVHNNGSHIPQEVLQKIFKERFTSGNKNELKENSYGLGLLIVKEIVEGHQGEIHVESTPQTGTTFIITLPKE
ncbi:MAG: sensor histidine kinase [Christiangramia sp.]